MNDYFKKKDFMVEWKDNKGKIHKTKVLGKFCSASEAGDYIYSSRKTCEDVISSWWI